VNYSHAVTDDTAIHQKTLLYIRLSLIAIVLGVVNMILTKSSSHGYDIADVEYKVLPLTLIIIFIHHNKYYGSENTIRIIE